MANFKGQQPENALPPMGTMPDQPQGQNDPKVQEIMKKADGYVNVLVNMIHGKKTREEVVQLLRSNPDPLISVPQAAMSINDMAVMAMKQGGAKQVEPAVQLVASQYLIDDLLKLGEACQAFEPVDEGEIEAILEDTYQMYVERGLKDKSIDPIQLQIDAEQLMSDEQKAGGMALGAGKVPGGPQPEQMQEQRVNSEVNKALSSRKAMEAKKQAQAKQNALAERALQSGGN